MFKEIFHNLDHVQVLSRISLVIFVIVFLSTLGWVYTRAKRDLAHWSALPLDDGLDGEPRSGSISSSSSDKDGAR